MVRGAGLRPPGRGARKNLTVRCFSLVHRIRFAGTRAVGVEYSPALGQSRAHGRPRTVEAGEVVLCGGAFNTPQLLQLSGVGNADELGRLGIDVVHDLPGVGENLQDHLETYVQYASQAAGEHRAGAEAAAASGDRPAVARCGAPAPRRRTTSRAAASSGATTDVGYPNLMFHFLPIAIRYDGTQPAEGHGYQVHIGPMYSDARGSVKIRSRDPRVHPALRFNYLSTETDRREWVEAIRVAREILTAPAFEPFNAGELSPGPAVETDEQVLDWVARDAETALHPSCTARMGTGPLDVTDPLTMGVHGVDGLRVVDASAMPYVTNGNIYAPVMMLAEKAADVILGATPLAPEPVPFYRHRPTAA